nr:hypothetical protein REQ54_04321 [Rhizobium sp. Q54]
MVINDVEDNTDAEAVGFINEGANIVWTSIKVRGGVEEGPVVSPAESSFELIDRHDF